MSEKQGLKDKRVLVIGGGSGIGLGIAKALEAEGCRVAIAGRTKSKLDEAIAGTGMKARTCDAADRESVMALSGWFEEVMNGPVEILAYCAGINTPKRNFDNMDPADFEKVVQVNLTGAYHAIQAVLPGMKARGDGLIFNVISQAGIQTVPIAGVAYSVSKVAQSWLGRFANLDALESGVRLTNVFPGETDTPILDQRPEPPGPEARAEMVKPEDIAAMVVAIAKLPSRVVVPEIVVTTRYMPRV